MVFDYIYILKILQGWRNDVPKSSSYSPTNQLIETLEVKQ